MINRVFFDYKQIICKYPQEILFSASHYFFGGFGQTFFIAFLIPFIKIDYHISDYQFGIYYGICTLLSALLLPLFGKIYDRTNTKFFSLITLFFLALGLILIASNINFFLVISGIFFIRFCGQGLFSQISTTTTARYFDHSRGKALSLVSLGASVSEALFPVIFIALNKLVSWQITLLIFTLCMLIFYCSFYSFGLKKTHPFYQIKNQDEHSKISQKNKTYSFLNLKIIYLMLQFSMPAFILTGLFFHKISIGNLKTWSQEFLALCFILFAISKILFSLISGPLIDNYSAKKLSKFYLLPMILSLTCFWISDYSISAIFYLIFAGSTLGIASNIQTSLWAEIFPKQILGSIKSIMLQCIIFSTAVAPALFGMILDSSFDFHFFILILIVINIIFFLINIFYLDYKTSKL